MQIYSTSRRLTACVGLLLLLLPSVAAAQGRQRFVVFGDSLSDAGNFFADTGEAVHIPVEPIPSAPYAIGGHHFSNGATWIEQLATRAHANPSANPSVVNPGRFTNYAFGRARARAGAASFPLHDLGTQVGRFLSDFGNAAPPDATYVIWIGTNDARDAFAAAGDVSIVTASITAIAGNIGQLLQHGARKFVVLNVPNLGLLPAVNQLPAPFPALATGFTALVNQALGVALDAVEPAILVAGGELVRVDTFQLLNAISVNPAAWGFENATDSCLSFDGAPFKCRNPDAYLFWDGGHPTKAGHEVLSREIAAILP